MSNRDILISWGYEESIVFENPDYDSAIIGVTTDDRVVYDFDLMVKHLVEVDGMSELEAVEWIDYNTIRALPYTPEAPVIIRRLEEV